MGFKDFPDMMRLAQEAKKVQKGQEEVQREQIEILQRIENHLLEVLSELKKR